MSLSITDFQTISNGSYNAGEITLTKSGKLDKVNNHVGILKGWNTKTISAATTLEVKNAFVQALKDAGVGAADLDKVREELGLPKSGSTKGFDLSRLKPLTRAQTREILDRFEGVINEKAESTVVSNKWADLKARGDQTYKDHMALAAQTNQRTVENRAASQRRLGMEIMDYGADSIPSGIRKSGDYGRLSAAEKATFGKIFTAMLFHGGSDVDSIAAEAMKKTLSAKDRKPVELHKMQIIENAKNLARSKGMELADEEVLLMMDEMSEWEDIKPGQLKNFEKWSQDANVGYIKQSISGELRGGKKKPLEFDEDGVCTQFAMDCYRSKLTFITPKDVKADKTGNAQEDVRTDFRVTGKSEDATTRCQHFCKLLPNKADRMLISGLMNQATLVTIAGLNSNGFIDPDDHSENPPRVISLEPEEGKRVPHWSTENENGMLAIMQPRSTDSWRFELKVDDKSKTAKLTITADYEIRPTDNVGDGTLGQAGKVALLVSSYEIEITGLESGDPQVASFGFRQEIEAQNL